MGTNRKGAAAPISPVAVSIAFTLIIGGVVEASESAVSSDWSAIIEITRLLLWSFTLSLVLLVITLVGSGLALKHHDAEETADQLLVDAIEDIGSTFDTLERKLLTGNMSRDAYKKARTFLEGRARFDRRGPVIRRKAA